MRRKENIEIMKNFISVVLSLLIAVSAAACSQDTVSENESAASSEEESTAIEYTVDSTVSEDEDDTISQSAFLDGESSLESTAESQKDTEVSSQEEKDPFLTEYNDTTCNIFRKVVCCGDSYTAGFIADSKGESHKINEDYAWPHYMSLITGNEYVNCGCSGCNVLTWQEHTRALPAAKKAGKTQAYIIGLMINDCGVKSHVDLGTESDIGTNKETYYAGMSAIIRELNKISPKAKIFVNTCPRQEEEFIEYNHAVRVIVDAYRDTYPVHCIDLAANSELFETESFEKDFYHGHYTPVGYEQMAEIYSKLWSRYINEHSEEFRDVAFIEYD